MILSLYDIFHAEVCLWSIKNTQPLQPRLRTSINDFEAVCMAADCTELKQCLKRAFINLVLHRMYQGISSDSYVHKLAYYKIEAKYSFG